MIRNKLLIITITILLFNCENTPIEDLTNGSLSGIITGTSQEDLISGATITTSPGSSITISDISGNFSINNLIEGQYSIIVEKDNFIKNISNIYVMPGKETILSLQLTLKVDSYGSITGLIKEADGTLVTNANISTTPGTSSVLTDSNGKFTISNIPVGDYSVTVVKPLYTTYSTSISVREGEETKADMVLAFDTEDNNSPASALNPYPANNVTNIATSTRITWECSDPDDDPILYDVYMWASGTTFTKIASNVSTKYYNFSSALLTSTAYYWFITAKDNKDGVSVSQIWKFTTQ